VYAFWSLLWQDFFTADVFVCVVQICTNTSVNLGNMEQHTAWLPGSSASYSYCSAVTYGCPWLSDKPYVDKVLPTYVNQASTLHSRFDVGNGGDIHSSAANAKLLPFSGGDRMRSQIASQNERQHGSDSGCSISSTLVDDIQLSPLTDTVSTDADSTGVTVATDTYVDHPGELTATECEMQSTVPRNNVTAEDFGDEVQPLGNSSVCSVCGDVAAGFHCGAYVCEACKVRTLPYLRP